MPERSLDQVIAHYQAAGQQVTMPTPVQPPMVTPHMAQRPPYIVPNAFQKTYAPGMGRTIEMYMSRGTSMGGMEQMAPPVTPQPIMAAPIPMAGLTPNPMFHDPFQARAQQQVGSLGTSAAAINRQWVAQSGQRWGGVVGGGLGAVGGGMIGGLGGAFTGETLGEMFGGWAGNVANAIPGVGHAMRGYNQLRWGGAMQDMAGANRLRQGMLGNVQMSGGGGDMMTGTGLSAQGALGMSQDFGRAKIPGMNRNDLVNLAGAAGETGFLDSATDIGQITKTVKGLARLMGEMAKLTGDPDFRNNLRNLQNLRNTGMTTDQSMEFMRNAPMMGRMAGSAGRAQAGANIGGAMFQQMGLTPGLGMQTGAATAGIVHRGMGGVSDIQRGMWGGESGISKHMTEMQAQFMGQTSKMLLPYLVDRDKDGKLSINEDRMKSFRSGEIGFQDMVQQGAANMGGLGLGGLQDLLMQAPELQTELGQKIGPMGGYVSMANMARKLQQEMPSLTLGGAAAQVAGGAQQGRMLHQFMTNPNVSKRLIQDINVQQKQLKDKGRRDALASQVGESTFSERRAAENKLFLDRGGESQDWSPLGVGRSAAQALFGGSQELEAFERTRDQEIEDSERTGLRRMIDRPGMRVSDKEVELADKRLSTGMKSALEQVEDPTTGVAAGQVSDAQRQAVFEWQGGATFGEYKSDTFGGSPVHSRGLQAIGDFLHGGSATVQESFQRRLEHVKATGTRLTETRKITEKQYEAGEQKMYKSMEEQFGDNYAQIIAAIKVRVIEYARAVGAGNTVGGMKMTKIRQIIQGVLKANSGGRMTSSQAAKWMEKNGDAMERWAIHWIDQAGDVNSKRALQQTERAQGMAKNAFNAEAAEQTQAELGKRANEKYFEMGLAAKNDGPTKPEEEGISALYSEEDASVRAAATLMGESSVGSTQENAALEAKMITLQKEMGPEKWARAKVLAKKLDPGQIDRMRQRVGGKIARGETTIEAHATSMEQGIHGEGKDKAMAYRTWAAKMEGNRRDAGTDGTTEVGEGAGLGTKESSKQVAILEEQKVMLKDMATNMNLAAKTWLEAAGGVKEAKLKAAAPRATSVAGHTIGGYIADAILG